jgi:hypothetical protein
MGIHQGHQPLLCFSITSTTRSPAQAAAGGKSVRVKAVVDSQYYPASIPRHWTFARGGTEEVLVLDILPSRVRTTTPREWQRCWKHWVRSIRPFHPENFPNHVAASDTTDGEMYISMHYIATNEERMNTGRALH